MKKLILFSILALSLTFSVKYAMAADTDCAVIHPGYSCVECGNRCETYKCIAGTQAPWPCPGGKTLQCCPAGTPQIRSSENQVFQGVSCKESGDCKVEDMIAVALNITNLLLGLIGSIALLFFIVAGLQMIISQGNSEKISSAKSMMLNSVIGIAIALCSFIAIGFLQKNVLKIEKKYTIPTEKIVPGATQNNE